MSHENPLELWLFEDNDLHALTVSTELDAGLRGEYNLSRRTTVGASLMLIRQAHEGKVAAPQAIILDGNLHGSTSKNGKDARDITHELRRLHMTPLIIGFSSLAMRDVLQTDFDSSYDSQKVPLKVVQILNGAFFSVEE